ncbi:tetratricopeptide repeat protein [Aequorivita sp. SDUM287046]|uniref:Tetratricopeptide repeat protein n=1 Tax=Aequorivita aurantiaca TaxID=3053356 RepID=A0ABT8DKG8_9FLAO|nr:tetratricopeptide repeat protein [Aequorivita aurantiaca]MDN3723532.1 tetratricopeptide repeat protein [Aequorivita aurantiaca]
MKTRILITGLAFVSAISFGQKKEIKKAEKAIQSNDYNEALNYLKEAEPMLGSVDNDVKAQYYAARGQALLGSGSSDFTKLKNAAEAFNQALTLDPKIESQLAAPIQNLRAALINSAVQDQTSGQYKTATEKLYTSYLVTKDPSDLYYAASNAVNGKDYESALKYYQMALDAGYTGEKEEFVATNKETGEVESFENENVRNIAVKSGQYIKPEKRVGESKKGEILRNMTLIYIEQGDNEKATALMKTARAENPNDIYLMRADADMSYKMGDISRYNQLMGQIVASDPENPEVYFNLGVGSAEIGQKEEAIKYYQKALELKPEYEAALINIAVLKLSGEDALVEEMNSLGNSRADNQRYDELKQQRNDIYTETLPYLEKALVLQPNSKEVVRTLMNIYGQLADDAKYKEMKAKLESLEK